MTEPKPNPDDLTRIIVLIYGMLDNGKPFWVFVAVKPSRYEAFQAAQKENKIDLYKFDNFGEIIVSGDTKSPPDEVILKIAEMYQTTTADLKETVEMADKQGRGENG